MVAPAQLDFPLRHAFPEGHPHRRRPQFVLHSKYGLQEDLIPSTKWSKFFDCYVSASAIQEFSESTDKKKGEFDIYKIK